MIKQITSTKNAMVAAIRTLKTRQARTEAGVYLVEGVKMVREAMQTATESVFVSTDANEQIKALANQANATVYEVPSHVMAAICDTKTPQGIAALVKLPKMPEIAQLGDKIIVLDDVQDPGNVGTILRTADAAGFTGTILSEQSADPFSPKCLRATMGSIFRMPILVTDDMVKTLLALKQEGFCVIASELSQDDFFKRKGVHTPLCLIIGNEGNGISKRVSEIATHHLALPMAGGAESLNAAIAAGIMMYELSFNS